MGANGAGKTTLASLLSGVLDAPARSVFLDGDDAAGMPAWAISERVGYVFQNPEHQFVTDTVHDELAFSLSPGGARRQAERLSPPQRALVATWLDRLGLLPLAKANPFSLSQGQKRRLSVAAMLIRGQAALILDEPTLGQDELQSDRLMAMMQELRSEGRAIVDGDARHAPGVRARRPGPRPGEGPGALPGVSRRASSQCLTEVGGAGLEMPSLGMVSRGLAASGGMENTFLTIRDFWPRPAPAPGGGGRRPCSRASALVGEVL